MAQRVGFKSPPLYLFQTHSREALVSITSCRLVANLQSIPIKAAVFDIFAALCFSSRVTASAFSPYTPQHSWSSFTGDSKLIRSFSPLNSPSRSSKLMMFLVIRNSFSD